jgi:putative hemolysin
MPFIEKHKIVKIVNQTMLTNDFSFNIISNIFGWKKANKFYDRVKSLNAKQFLAAYKRNSRIKHIIPKNQLERIPATESLLIIANHPTGIPDGLLILDQVLKIRNDVKIVANELTYRVNPLKPHTIPVDPYESAESKVQNATQIRTILQWLNEGHCIILFPAGDVADYDFKKKEISEHFWHPTAKKIILKHKGAILPWAIAGKNSKLFYQLGKIHRVFKSALYPREGLKKRRRPIYSFIGKPCRINGDEALLNDLETKVKLMSISLVNKTKNPFKLPKKTTLVNVAEKRNIQKIESEISKLNSPLITKGNYQVFSTTYIESPELILEIGRLREITFRSVNEGSGKERDLDKYDEQFAHLILWDDENKEIVGAYRLGDGTKLHTEKNYHSIMYDYYQKNKEIETVLKQSLILGRAFVREEYQQKAFPLFLLWQGINQYIKNTIEIKFVLGQTSLPNSYHPFTKALITGFILKHHCNKELIKHFNAFFPYKNEPNKLVSDWLNNPANIDFKRLDRIVECVEPDGNKLPILFRRYIEQNAVCIGINIDPDFQNSIDILMLTKVEDIQVN